MVPIGVACHTANKGGIDFMSLATTTTAVLISFDKQKVRKPHKDILSLLSAGGITVAGTQLKCCLVGFSMAFNAIQIAQATKLEVKGVDLSHMSISAKRNHLTPVEVVVNVTSPDTVDRWRISLLWLGTNQSSKSDICLQSWLAAWYVNPNHNNPSSYLTKFIVSVGSRAVAQVETAVKVNTVFMNASVLCF